jgi:hypothetical protein
MYVVTEAISAPMPRPAMKRKMISSVTFVLVAARMVPSEKTATDSPRLSRRPHLSAIAPSAKAPMM